ncbi:MAG: hypothetical protein JRG93_06665 [Deltaproteobacteria bacterium]|nr:hypothetical protein [Deltaproteobacteria bacterium]MBW2717997.1 hypothetical protein [Deltaproteobacteria bacterium]
MLRMIAFAALGLVACTQLPPAPGTGGAGGEGAGGAGGSAGAAGMGAGGAGGVMTSCTTGVPQAYDALEEGDTVEQSFALGKVSGVCPSPSSCEGNDTYDRWTFTGCEGTQKIELSWDEPAHDLNLFVYTEDMSINLAAQGAEGAIEVIQVELGEERSLIIQVQANGTGGGTAEQSYCLEVIPPETANGAEPFCKFQK